MANEVFTTIVGNLTRDVELRYTAAGKAMATFGLAYSPRRRDEQGNWSNGDTSFFDCTLFGVPAENLNDSVVKGDRLIVVGQPQMRSWTTESGEKRSKISFLVDHVGVDLRFATVEVRKGRDRPARQAPAGAVGGDYYGQADEGDEPF